MTVHQRLHEAFVGKSRVATLLATLAFTGVGLAREGAAQPVTVITGDRAQCRSCTVIARRRLVLRVPDTEPALVSPFGFAMDSRGFVYLADPFGTIGIRVFDSKGRFVRQVGKRGQGPGEFMMIGNLAIGPGDTLHVFHAGHSVFAPSGKHVRTRTALDGAMARAVRSLPSGGFVVAASLSDAASHGQPFHHLGKSNEIIRSFGATPEPVPGGPFSSFWQLSNPLNGTIWAARQNVYAIDRWSVSNGQRLQRVVRATEWFKSWSEWHSRPNAEPPPPPRVMAIAGDAATGHLWVLLSVAAADWRPFRAPAGDGSNEDRMLTTGELARVFDSIIEVLDPKAGVLLSSRRFGNFFVDFAAPGVAVELFEEKDETLVGLWDLSLRTERPSRK
jgi:hypothetical protein